MVSRGFRKDLNPITVQRSIVTSPIYKLGLLNDQEESNISLKELKELVEKDRDRAEALLKGEYGRGPGVIPALREERIAASRKEVDGGISPRNDTVIISSPTVPCTVSVSVGSSTTTCGLQHW